MTVSQNRLLHHFVTEQITVCLCHRTDHSISPFTATQRNGNVLDEITGFTYLCGVLDNTSLGGNPSKSVGVQKGTGLTVQDLDCWAGWTWGMVVKSMVSRSTPSRPSYPPYTFYPSVIGS